MHSKDSHVKREEEEEDSLGNEKNNRSESSEGKG